MTRNHKLCSTLAEGNVWEFLQYLTATKYRFQILKAIENQPHDLRTLKDELGIPRSTLQRNLTTLKDRGVIEESNGKYRGTTGSPLLLSSLEDFLSAVETFNRLSPFLNRVGNTDELEIDVLANATVTVPEANRPHLPNKRLLEELSETNKVRGVWPYNSFLLASSWT